jgi:Mn2+/Fe2+ NRAMP family transporter
VPFAAAAVWLVLWRVKFSSMERVFGLLGLALVVFVVALIQLGPDWSALAADVATPSPPDWDWGTYGFFAVSLFAAALTP